MNKPTFDNYKTLLSEQEIENVNKYGIYELKRALLFGAAAIGIILIAAVFTTDFGFAVKARELIQNLR